MLCINLMYVYVESSCTSTGTLWPELRRWGEVEASGLALSGNSTGRRGPRFEVVYVHGEIIREKTWVYKIHIYIYIILSYNPGYYSYNPKPSKKFKEEISIHCIYCIRKRLFCTSLRILTETSQGDPWGTEIRGAWETPCRELLETVGAPGGAASGWGRGRGEGERKRWKFIPLESMNIIYCDLCSQND